MDVCLPVCKMGFSVCRPVRVANGVPCMFRVLQTATLSLQTGAVCKYGALARRPVCKLSFFKSLDLQTGTRSANCVKVSPSLQTGLSLQTEPVRRLRPTYISMALVPTCVLAWDTRVSVTPSSHDRALQGEFCARRAPAAPAGGWCIGGRARASSPSRRTSPGAIAG